MSHFLNDSFTIGSNYNHPPEVFACFFFCFFFSNMWLNGPACAEAKASIVRRKSSPACLGRVSLECLLLILWVQSSRLLRCVCVCACVRFSGLLYQFGITARFSRCANICTLQQLSWKPGVTPDKEVGLLLIDGIMFTAPV